jgi:signal transduction histidine kinase/CheY-like chemotaxis protein
MVVNRFVVENRRQIKRYQELAETLAETNRKLEQAQEEARRSERLAALGQMSAGLAHEIRNPLGVIKGIGGNAASEAWGVESAGQRTGGLHFERDESLERAGDAVLDFARPLHAELKPQDITRVLDRALHDVAVTRKRRRRLKCAWSGSIRAELAAGSAGRESLRAGVRESDSECLRCHGQRRRNIAGDGGEGKHADNEDGVEVRIEDTGPGIPAELREQIFNPFVTTKKTGVGLGLSIVSRIIDGHHGTIRVESGWDGSGPPGARFVYFFPGATRLQNTLHPRRVEFKSSWTEVERPENMPTILIVEDEAKMRRLLELNLGEDGFSTLSAGDAETGLKLLRENTVDLVVTDLKLPGMNGLEFLQAIKRQNAALPVVVMTAFGTVETAVEAMKAGASDYVLKPFSLSEMRMVIRKELDVHNLREENRSLREALGKRYAHPNVVARSAKMQEVLATVERVAPTNSTVLLGGESGVGKDLIARAIHEKSRRAAGPFHQNQQHRDSGESAGERTVWL